MSIDRSLNIPLADYDVRQIADGVYKINEYNLSTMSLVVGTERALAIDCGTGVGDYLAVLKKITDKPITLVATHAHVDHIGGREQFDELYLSKNDEPIVKDVTVLYRKFYIAVSKYLMRFKVIDWKKAVIKKVRKEPTLKFVKEGDEFALGGKTIRVFETPGHTLGSISLLDVEDRILFTGDVINPNNLMFLKHAATIETLNATSHKIDELDGYDTVWASHLADPLPKEVRDDGIRCTEQILKKKNGFPMILFGNYNGYVIIHLAHKRRNKKK